MKHIVLDTNFLLIPAQLGIDIYAEIERIMDEPYTVYIVERTLKELEYITQKGGQKEKRAVTLALDILKTKNIKTVSCDQGIGVDDTLVALSKKGYIIATQDIPLKKRLQGGHIGLRQKKYLTFHGG
jgi:rRNA-processing protein FCF1